MANSKKLQYDIDRDLRRTREGLESYEELYNKFLKAGTQSQKERFEGDLKKEIKKLQRHRDGIKTYIANPEVKETTMLEFYQKAIEEKMEVFKMCERETKTKAFSKEGLAANSPNETPQAHSEAWLKSAMDDARKQIEIIEYDVERNTRGHHGRGKNAQSAEAVRLQRLKFHLGKLEQLLKLVTNGDADLDEVDAIEGQVQRLLQNDGGSDDLDVDEDERLYMMFDLDDVTEKRRSGVDEDNSISAAALQKGRAASPTTMAKPATQSNTTPITSTTTTTAATATPGKKVTPSSAASASVGKAGLPRRQGTSQSSPTTISPGPATMTKSASSRDAPMEAWDENAALLDDDMDKANADTFGDDAMEMAGTGSLAEMAKATGSLPPMGDWEKGRPASLVSPPSATAGKAQVAEQSSPPQQPAAATTTTNASAATAAAAQLQQQPAATAAAASPPPQRTTESKHHASATSSATNHAPAATATTTTTYDKATMLQLVDMSLANLPHTQDVDRQRPFEPSNPTTCPSYYPQQVLPALASPDIYREFDLETLFFIFYYHQNTYQQYYAAKQIKAQSFRYHTQLNTWFQRNGRLKESQEGGERGSFIFFNYEDTWRIEEKEDFTFNYQYLEDELR